MRSPNKSDRQEIPAASQQRSSVMESTANPAPMISTAATTAMAASRRRRPGRPRIRDPSAISRIPSTTNSIVATDRIFEREILPRLLGVPVCALAEATGLSVGYCRQVKKGTATPHPMWWDAMRIMGRWPLGGCAEVRIRDLARGISA